MNQLGLNMPGGQMQRGPSMNVYTGLLMMAAVALIAACAFVALYAQPKVSPDGGPLSVQEFNETTKQWTIKLP